MDEKKGLEIQRQLRKGRRKMNKGKLTGPGPPRVRKASFEQPWQSSSTVAVVVDKNFVLVNRPSKWGKTVLVVVQPGVTTGGAASLVGIINV